MGSQATDSDGIEALLKQGFELHQQARFTEAIPILEQARTLEPTNYFVNLLLGIDLLRTGKTADAIPRLQLAARANPAEEFPEDYLGEAEATLGHPALAAEAYQRAMLRGHNSEESLEAWAGFALERFRQIGEQLRASQAGLEVARKLQKVETASNVGSTPGGDCASLIPSLERKYAQLPQGVAGATAYRLSLCYAEEAGKASALLGAASENAAGIHRLRGDVLLRLQGDGASAQAEYKQALAIAPHDPGLMERLAEAQLAAGDTAAAEESAKAALAIDPHRRTALRSLAEIAMSNRDYEQALPWLQQLVTESPHDPSAQVELGRALAQTGDWAAALRWLRAPLAAGYPDEKGALHGLLAKVLRKLGRDPEALKADIEARRLSNAFQEKGTQTTDTPAHPDKGSSHTN